MNDTQISHPFCHKNILFSIFQSELGRNEEHEAQRGDVKRRGAIGADVSIALLVTLLAGRKFHDMYIGFPQQ